MKIGFACDHAAVDLKNTLLEYLKGKGYEVIACEPFIKGDVAGFQNHTLEEAMAECDYAVITLMHTPFLENKALIATKPYYDCVGLMR
mgnify:FL=1